MLASPRYGERWGRHWLDVAGYADSEGKTEQDLPRPYAYRYRDYVVRSFNSDKPYDRFLLEQIAGDELADYENADGITPELYDNLVATGLFRMGPDATWANINAFVPDRLEVIADTRQVLGSGVLGLTVQCARCHSHKFDPIPQRDYYRLAALFKGAYDEHDWMKPNTGGPTKHDPAQSSFRYLPYVTSDERREWEAREGRLAQEIESLKSARDETTRLAKKEYFAKRLAEIPDVLRDDVRRALDTDAAQRDAVQTYLAQKLEPVLRPGDEALKKADEAYRRSVEDLDQQIESRENDRRPEPLIRALWDRGEPSPTYLLRRGNYLTPGDPVSPGPLSVLTAPDQPFEITPPWPGAKKTGRRLALARWLTDPNHPLTARVMVNRIWKHHFEHGLVRSLGNFGRSGSPPTHPELLDWLACEFVGSGWSVKHMHRLIMTSSTYRQASARRPESEQLDPDNALLSRFPLKRMEAEVLSDTLLLVSGELNEARYGPADGVDLRADGLVTPRGTERGWRRSVYVEQRRKQIPTALEAFDLPQMSPHCLERPTSTVATQALFLMNDAMVRNLAQSLARRVAREAGDKPADRVERLFLIALSRRPSPEEAQLTVAALEQLTRRWSEEPISEGSQPDGPALRALANVSHALINSAAFLYID